MENKKTLWNFNWHLIGNVCTWKHLTYFSEKSQAFVIWPKVKKALSILFMVFLSLKPCSWLKHGRLNNKIGNVTA